MQIDDDDPGGYYPVQDFVKNSKTLNRIDWSSRLMAGLIRSGYLGGFRDRVSGIYFTSKKKILEALALRNQLNMVVKVDLLEAKIEIPKRPDHFKGKDFGNFLG